jgi:hypothetical protein
VIGGQRLAVHAHGQERLQAIDGVERHDPTRSWL